MSKVKIEGNASGTGTFTIQAPNSNSDRVLSLPDNAGEIITSSTALADTNLSNVPVCRAYKNDGNQSFSSNSWTKVTMTTEAFDTDGIYDAANSKLQPSIAGYYNVNFRVQVVGLTSVKRVIGGIYRNGSVYTRGSELFLDSETYGDEYGSSGSSVLYFNGTTDYAEFYVYALGTNLLAHSSPYTTYMDAILIRAGAN